MLAGPNLEKNLVWEHMFLGYTHYILNRYNSLTSNVFSLDFKKDRLPEGWVNIPFKNLVKKIPLTGRKIKQKEYLKNGTIPIIDQGQDFIGGYTEDTKKIVNCNLPVIVFGDHTKSIKFVDCEFAAGADGIKVLEPNPNLNQKWLYYFMQAIQLPDKNYARHYQYLEKAVMNIPPFTEQKRIVAKLESIFAQIDAVKEQLEMMTSQTKFASDSFNMLRSSVLKQAFEGRLMPQDPKDEPAEVMLTTLHKYSEKELKFDKEGLPKGWVILPFENIKPSTKRFDPIKEKNQKYVGLEHIEKDTGRIIGSQESKTTVSLKTVFCKGDLLYGKLRPYLNKVAIADFDGVCSTDILVFQQNPFIANAFLKFCLLKSNFVEFANRTITGIQHPRTSHKKLSDYPIPLPPLLEQHRIVAKIESIFAKIDEKQKDIQKLEMHLKSIPDSFGILRSSILKQAFEGKLVLQDPNDEPASVLLEKIKLQKSKKV